MPGIPQPSDKPQLTSKAGPQFQEGEEPLRMFVGFNSIIGVDSSAARMDIPENKAYYLENVMPIGDGKLRVVPNISAALYNFAEPVYTARSINLNNTEYIVAFGNSGKVYLYNVVQQTSIILNETQPLSGVGSWCDQWFNTDILFIDSTGYFDYNITSGQYKKLAGTGTPSGGNTLAVYQDRVWIVNGRNLYVSGAGGFDDGSINSQNINYWLPVNGAAYSILVDPAIRSNITRMAQSNGLLYLFHATGVNVISNVNVPLGSVPPTPLWENDNIQAAIGTDQPYSVVQYDRYNLFASKQGAYMMYGLAAPQLSSDMIGTWQYLDFTKPIFAAQCVVFQQLCAAFLLNRKGDPNLPDATVIALWFNRAGNDRWFFCNFGNVSVIVNSWINGVPVLYAVIGTQLYQCFYGGTPPATIMKTKLWTMEDPTQRKELLRAGCLVDVTVPGSSFTMTVDDENGGSDTIASIPGSTVGQIGSFLMNGSSPPNNARSLGFTIQTVGYDFALHFVACDYKLRQRWGVPAL